LVLNANIMVGNAGWQMLEEELYPLGIRLQ
jgi:hypothetical protein